MLCRCPSCSWARSALWLQKGCALLNGGLFGVSHEMHGLAAARLVHLVVMAVCVQAAVRAGEHSGLRSILPHAHALQRVAARSS